MTLTFSTSRQEQQLPLPFFHDPHQVPFLTNLLELSGYPLRFFCKFLEHSLCVCTDTGRSPLYLNEEEIFSSDEIVCRKKGGASFDPSHSFSSAHGHLLHGTGFVFATFQIEIWIKECYNLETIA